MASDPAGGPATARERAGAPGARWRATAGPLAPAQVVAAASAAVEEADPMAFLRRARRVPRGFWQEGEGWVAWAGTVAEVGWPTGPGAEERYRGVRRAADRLLASVERSEPGDASPRLYGGFAFGGDRPAGPRDGPSNGGGPAVWGGFPAARFVLPALTLEGRAGELRLRVHAAGSRREEARAEAARLVERAARALGRPARPARNGWGDAVAFRDSVSPHEWAASVERVLAAIAAGRARKVVLARALDVTLAGAPGPVGILARLRVGNPDTTLFLCQFSSASAFLGAAPELLAAVRGDRVRTMAVAGSAGRGGTRAEDARLGRELLASRKDRTEHAVGVEELRERLAALAAEVEADAAPRLLRLAGIQHLQTDVRARVEGCHALDLVEALHPMAAVCGYPRGSALRILRAEEPVARGWYGGPIGWFDGRGDGTFAPGLRSALVRGRELRLFAGAGLVEGSRADAEWEETRIKLQIVLRALGVTRRP